MSASVESLVVSERCELAYLKLAQRMRDRALQALLTGDENYGLYSRTATALAQAGQSLAALVTGDISEQSEPTEGGINGTETTHQHG